MSSAPANEAKAPVSCDEPDVSDALARRAVTWNSHLEVNHSPSPINDLDFAALVPMLWFLPEELKIARCTHARSEPATPQRRSRRCWLTPLVAAG